MSAGRHGNGHGRCSGTTECQCGRGRNRSARTEDGQENRIRRGNRFGSDVLMESPAADASTPMRGAGMGRGGYGRGLRLRDGSCRARVNTKPERPEE